MALETGSFIDDLVVTNPLGADAKNKGDDHLQLVKKVVKATFPGMVGAAWRVQAKTGTYTVVAGDNMSVLNCTTDLTLNLTAAATLGNQHMFLVIANGGAVTIDPDAAETVNGAATLVVADGSSAFVICAGALFLATVATGAVITTRGDVLRGDSTGVVERLALGAADEVLQSDGTDLVFDVAPLPRSYGAGCALSNDTDATNDINVTAGAWRNADDDGNLVLSSEQTKQIDASWATGDDAGGLSSSLTVTNDTWYHVHLILVSSVVEVGFDTSVVAANLIADHSATKFRRIGSVRRGTATNLAFVQAGDHFEFKTMVSDVNVTNPGSSAVTRTLTVPGGVSVEALFNVQVEDTGGGTNAILFSALDTTDELPSLSAAPSGNAGQVLTGEDWFGDFRIRANDNSRIRSRFSSGGAAKLRISTRGWIDRRGRDD